MNFIIELIEKARVELINENNTTVVIDGLIEEVKKEHKKQILAAYNRGRASNMGMFMMSDEQYYDKYYG
tara:strand:+ start:1769 stop:1975 length:207 start_codon:yes stop_codon:yes gene_type:complete